MKRVQAPQYKINTMKVTNSVEKGTPNQGIGLLEFSDNGEFLACRNGKSKYIYRQYAIYCMDLGYLQIIANQYNLL